MNILDKLIESARLYIRRPHIRYCAGQWMCYHRGASSGMGYGRTPQDAYRMWDQKRQGSRNTHA